MVAVSIADLWLPIVLSAVAVFIAGALAWMVLPHHRKDWAQLPSSVVLDALRSVPPGQYMFPGAGPKEHTDPQTAERSRGGPHGAVYVWPGPPAMGAKMGLNFIFNLTVAVFVAYLTSRAVPSGAAFLDVFRMAGTAGVMSFCFGGIPHGIWFGRSPRSMAMDFMDGAFEGLLVGAVFASLWP